MYASNVIPETISTTKPRISELYPYAPGDIGQIRSEAPKVAQETHSRFQAQKSMEFQVILPKKPSDDLLTELLRATDAKEVCVP